MRAKSTNGEVRARLLAALMIAASSATAQQITLLEKKNAALIPSGEPAAPYHVETSSAVLPPGHPKCPNGCVVISYGSPGATLMRGALNCLGQPGCMKRIDLQPPAGQITGVDGHVTNGVCLGATTTAKYELSWTDSQVGRGFDGSLFFVRGGNRVFADPQAGCKIARRGLNVVYRSVNGGIDWTAQTLDPDATGMPWYDHGMDRYEFYADPYTQTLYLAGGAGTFKSGINTLALWASTNNGGEWHKVSAPLQGKFGAYPPLYMASTPNRLYMATCADNMYPPLNPHPVLGWSEDHGKTWKLSEGSPLQSMVCNTADKANIAGGISPNLTFVTLAPLRVGAGTIDIVRLAFPSLEGTQETVKVVNVTVSGDGIVSVSPSLTVQPANGASAIHPSLIRTDRFEMPAGDRGADTAVLWWLEAGNPNLSKRAEVTAKFRVSTGSAGWSEEHSLSTIMGQLSGAPVGVVVSWVPRSLNNNDGFIGDYDNGSFFYNPASRVPLHFFAQWSQTDATVASSNAFIHYNIVAVPEPTETSRNWLSGVVLVPARACAQCPPSPCLSCPPLDLIFDSEVEAPVEIMLHDAVTHRQVGSFTVEAKEGVNSVRLGDGKAGSAVELLVTARTSRAPAITPLRVRSVSLPEIKRVPAPVGSPPKLGRPDERWGEAARQ